ncbi:MULTISPECIES: hypothetical protein [Erysipelotrichaceae]|uniref:hypothetical protein n=1 Tax=Erysipelotrichaceae TaxID=128827 RepID=UPI0018F3C132|nr:hypothetical protein [Absiella sp. AM27-20]
MLSQVLMTGYPIVLTALCGYIVWLLQEQRKETKKKEAEIEKHQKANFVGTRCLLRQQLMEYHDKYTALEYITPSAYENLCEMLQAYEDLGGNGKVHKMSQETMALPIKNYEEE